MIVKDLRQQKKQFIPPLKKVLVKPPMKDPEKMTILFSALIDGMNFRLLHMDYEYSMEFRFEFYMERFKKI